MPPALGLFSTMMVVPSGLPMPCATTRATVSVGPPAANGTIMLTLRVGYCCAWAPPERANAANAMAETMVETEALLIFSSSSLLDLSLLELARPAGFEPTTLGFGGQYSNPLSYGRFQAKIIPLSLTGANGSERPRRAFVLHQDAAATGCGHPR